MNFEVMISEAEKVLNEKGIRRSVATALFTDKGSLYITFCANFCEGDKNKFCEDYKVLNEMIEAEDTKILKIAVVYKTQQTGLEVPCAWLRNFIYNMNKDNVNAEIILQGLEKRHVKVLGSLFNFESLPN